MGFTVDNLHEFGPQDKACAENVLDESGAIILDEAGNPLCAETVALEGGLKILVDVGTGVTFTIPTAQFADDGITAMVYAFTVTWGDGQSDVITAWDDTAKDHVYTNSGQYLVTILGTCQRIVFGNYSGFNASLVKEVQQWDHMEFKDFTFAFYDCDNMTITATDVPDISACTSFEQSFDTCTALTGGFEGWDVSNIVEYRWAFYDCDNLLNADFSSWDVSNCTSFFSMFENSTFNNDSIAGWDVSSATDMDGMFWGCDLGNLDLSAWDVSSVTTFNDMFHLSDGSTDLSGWDVSSGQIFTDMFSSSTFNGSLASWTFHPSQDLYFALMFKNNNVFNQPLASWDGLPNDFYCASMFEGCDAFNQDLSGWNAGTLQHCIDILKGCTSYSTANYDLLLNGWAAYGASVRSNLWFDCAAQYTIVTSQTARDYLDITRSWVLTDGGGI